MNFQDIIFTLQKFWSDQGCIIIQPYDMEVGAGTSSPYTTLRALSEDEWNVAYVQPCRRPTDGRYAKNPFRMQHYYQFQVIMKPSPSNIQQLCLDSFDALGVSTKSNDFRFVEDDWENPTLGAWGLGWELWCNGMEILQYTYMQQIGGMPLSNIPCELTYGLERIAMYIQNVDNVWDLKWNDKGVKYRDVFEESERQMCHYNFEEADVSKLQQNFNNHKGEAESMVKKSLPYPAYDQCLKAAHCFNLLEARGVLSVTERASYIGAIRDLSRACAELVVDQKKLEN